jgi:hypothetical protein
MTKNSLPFEVIRLDHIVLRCSHIEATIDMLDFGYDDTMALFSQNVLVAKHVIAKPRLHGSS